MKWQCALLQRWLPEYPDGDLPAWAKRWLRSHVAGCADCRRELAELREVAAAVAAAPPPDPGPEFWQGFSREMHLKLVQAAQDTQAAPAPSRSRWLRLPYLLGAPAVAVLLVWVTVNLTGPGLPVKQQASVARESQSPAKSEPVRAKMAAAPKPTPTQAEVTKVAEVPREGDQLVTVALDETTTLPVEDDDDVSVWGLDSELADMSDHEKEIFLKKLDQRKKDGSCLTGSSSFFWS
jgi:hypothetical protein